MKPQKQYKTGERRPKKIVFSRFGEIIQLYYFCSTRAYAYMYLNYTYAYTLPREQTRGALNGRLQIRERICHYYRSLSFILCLFTYLLSVSLSPFLFYSFSLSLTSLHYPYLAQPLSARFPISVDDNGASTAKAADYCYYCCPDDIQRR